MVQIKVKDIIEFLQTNFNPEARVYLDKDGWQISDDESNVQKVIKETNVFSKFEDSLFINN